MTAPTLPPREPDLTAPATWTLTFLTLTAALGMGRLFADWDFLVPFAVATFVAHGLSWWYRRVGVSLVTAVPLTVGGVGLAAAWTLFPHTTAYGIPWVGTWQAASDALREAWQGFATVVAPAPTAKGFLLAGMLGIGIAAVLADWAAFRVRAVFEATLPSFTLFVFTAVLGAAHYRGQSVAAYLLALLLFVLVHQAGAASESASWFASRSRGGVVALLQGGAVLAAVALLAALVVGPNLPGSASEPVIDWRDDGDEGPSRRTTISPLVDIRGRLVEQSSTEVFTVKASEPAYWRLTSLDTFDGSIWQSNDSYKPTDASLPGGVEVRAPQDQVVQEFTIESLSSIWLPAAYRASRIDGLEKVSFNRDTGSLITRSETTDGLTYRVQSAVPRLSAADLQTAPPLRPADLERYLALPPVSGRAVRLARDLTRGQPTPYARAKALQDFFHRGFTYDLKARPGHDGRALDRFLFETKRGYCEQFAGAYAVLARAVGLPARLAVGFTQGELGPDGRYHVRGLNAHAWPEVYLQGYGWVYFEATPGRGAPGAQPWTGLPTQQARPDNPSVATTAPPTTATTAPAETPTTDPANGDESLTTDSPEGKPSPLRHPLVTTLLVLVGLFALWAVAVPGARRALRARRRAAAVDSRDRVLVAWEEATEALAGAGVPRAPAETADEFARRAAREAKLSTHAAAALQELAHDMAPACYAAGPIAAEVVRRSLLHVAAVEDGLRENATPRQRLLRTLDPRFLWRSVDRRKVVNRPRAERAA
jgi:transglutaminase-like putative cysteine protease